MKRRRAGVALLLIVSVLIACNDDSSTSDGGSPPADATSPNDAGVSPDASPTDGGTDPFACASDFTPIPGGGSAKGPIDGSLSVMLVAPESERPLADAVVEVVHSGGRLTAKTGSSGCVRLTAPGLVGPVTLSVFAMNRVYETIIGHNAKEMTLWVGFPGSQPPPEPFATISGTVTNLDIIQPPMGSTRTGIVSQIVGSVLDGTPVQVGRPNNRLVDTNEVGGNNNYDDFSVRVYPSTTHGIYVLAGVATGTVASFSHLGVLRGVNVTPGATLANQDLTLTHPLDQAIRVGFGSAPSLPNRFIGAYLFFGDEGVVSFAASTPTLNYADFQAPALSDSLSEATYGGAAQVISEDAVSFVVEPGTSTGGMVDLGDLPRIPDNITVQGRTLSARFDLRGGAQRIPVALFSIYVGRNLRWAVTQLSAEASSSIVLPEVPAPMADPASGEVLLQASIAEYQDIDFNDVVFRDPKLNARVRTYSLKQLPVTF